MQATAGAGERVAGQIPGPEEGQRGAEPEGEAHPRRRVRDRGESELRHGERDRHPGRTLRAQGDGEERGTEGADGEGQAEHGHEHTRRCLTSRKSDVIAA